MKQKPLRLVATENRFAGLTPADLSEPEATTLIALAIQVLAARHQPGRALTSPDDTRAYLQLLFAERPNEVFVCLFLDVKHRVLAVEELFQGTIDGASVHPREVARRCLELGAGALIMVHNTRAGWPSPRSPTCVSRSASGRLWTSSTSGSWTTWWLPRRAVSLLRSEV
jgi:DNA repair protein RadC